MSTQACTAHCGGPKKSRLFNATCTDDAWTELTDDVASKSIGEVLKGQTVSKVTGAYAAGGAAWRIVNRDDVTQRGGHLALTTEEEREDFAPYVVKEGDRLEGFSVAGPT